MQTFIATLNESGCEKIGARAQKVALLGSILRFYEDDEKTAHIFYRRYIRNLTSVRLTDLDYSIYSPNYGEMSRGMGFHDSKAPG